MTTKLDTSIALDPQALMRDAHAQLASTYGLLRALSLSEDERRGQREKYGPQFTSPLSSGHAEALAGYIAEEVLLATRLAELLLETKPHQGEENADTSDLSLIELRRLANLTSDSSRLDAGEGLGTLLGGVTEIILWFTANAEHLEPLSPVVPALIMIRHRLETIEALTVAWTSAMLARRSKRAAA
ncbi:hypothetical protein [Halomonas sp. C05BenzN]|uniref:hypothetical protein n=1 Tax=Halomonas sp. C05BenzN TaxID=3411041 RepID=UPI003B93F06A